MIKLALRNAIVISVLGHLSVFSLFSFSFGHRIPKNDFAAVYSWGGILRKYDLIPKMPVAAVTLRKVFRAGPETAPFHNAKTEIAPLSQYYFKPQVHLPAYEEKIAFTQKLPSESFIRKRKEQVIMFHPRLPVNFLLFFKDRQAVHIELMFNMVSNAGVNSVTIKRKISSGNLEADLLSMRYISHYLFLQQTRLIQDSWQTVKIDLSTRND